MNSDEFSYKYLRKIQQMEEDSTVSTKIDITFYENLSKYIENLKKRLNDESSSYKQKILENEIKNTKKIAKEIYEIREKKIILSAISKARGGNPNIKNLIKEEINLFNSTFVIMIQYRNIFLENKSLKIEEKNLEKNEESLKIENDKTENANEILIVIEDIPEFIGIDTKKYMLKKGDIISLPDNMSNILLKRNVVKKINYDID